MQLESVVGVWSAFANVPTNGSWDGRGWSYGATRHVAILFVVKGCESCKVPLGNARGIRFWKPELVLGLQS